MCQKRVKRRHGPAKARPGARSGKSKGAKSTRKPVKATSRTCTPAKTVRTKKAR